MLKDYELLECDVLVVGGGMAGLSTAIRAAAFSDKVILVEKAKVTRSGGSVRSHAYGAPVPESLFQTRLKELVVRSSYLGDQAWFEILLREVGERFKEMEQWGVHFERDASGKLKSDAIRGQSKGFVVLAHGRQVIETLAQEARRRGVKFVERVAIFDLLTSDGAHPTQGNIVGAVGINTRTGQFVIFKCSAVVLCTGLISPKLHCYSMDNITGDGYAMAFRAGAEITGLEFSLQAFCVWNRKYCVSGPGQFQHGGSKLVNRSGEEFLYKYEGASREYIGFEGHFDQGAVCRAIAVEEMEGRGPCYFDCRGWSQEKLDNMHAVLPLSMKAFDEPGVGTDFKTAPIEATTMPAVYGTSVQSGIRINTLGETAVGGLFAVGATAYYGGGPSAQSLGAVAGYRTGEQAAKWAKDVKYTGNILNQAEMLRDALYAPLKREKGINPDRIYDSINELVTPWGASLFKSEKRINNVLTGINRIANDNLPEIKANDIHELIKAAEARNFVLLMELYNLASLERKESRMVHYREDYTFTDDINWRKWILLKNAGKGKTNICIAPVPLGCSAIVPDKLTIKPVPVAYKMGAKDDN